MNYVDSTPLYTSGMQKIERAINGALRDAGIKGAPAFLWHRGAEFMPLQESTTLEAILQDKTWNAELSREQIKACRARVEREDVILVVNDAVKTLSGRTRHLIRK